MTHLDQPGLELVVQEDIHTPHLHYPHTSISPTTSISRTTSIANQ
jgi:hypothetical protein